MTKVAARLAEEQAAATSSLPTEFQDPRILMEVGLATWRDVIEAAGDSARLSSVKTHDDLWRSLTESAPSRELFDALETIVELGTDEGRELLSQAAEDQQVHLLNDDEPARELAARAWLESRSRTDVAGVLVRARAALREGPNRRTYREFVAKTSQPLPKTLTTIQIESQIKAWRSQMEQNEAVNVYAYQRDGEWRCEILRGEAMKRVIEIRDSRPSILDFRPAASDHVRYDAVTGRLGIASRSRQLTAFYRQLLGRLLVGDDSHFLGEHICNLRPLQERGRTLFEPDRWPGIVGIDVTELRWRRGDRDQVFVKGRECFRILEDLGARLVEGELVEAVLSITFVGETRRGRVSLKSPSAIDIKAGMNERLVERMLDDVGIRGAFDLAEEDRRSIWALFPWRLKEEDWRHQLGPDFDRLVRQQILRSAHLYAVPHPDHPAARHALRVVPIDGSTVGVSDDPSIPLRSLTSSDATGYELDLGRAVAEVAGAIGLEDMPQELSPGLWRLGRRRLSPSMSFEALLVSRAPTPAITTVIQRVMSTCRVAVLVPDRCVYPDMLSVPCRFPRGPYDDLLTDIVERLGAADDVPLTEWRSDDLLIDVPSGRAWYRQVLLTDLKPGTHPFNFAVRLARAPGRVVEAQTLKQELSGKRTDDDVAKKAKAAFLRAVRTSFASIGQELPTDIAHIVETVKGGYRLAVSGYVRRRSGDAPVT